MAGTVVFLGAGATKACGGPLTNEILPQIVRAPAALSAGRLNLLKTFLKDLFHVGPDSADEAYPGLPLLMSLIDTALDRRQSFHPGWDPGRLTDLRVAVELAIFDMLEDRLHQAPTNNHYRLMKTIYGTAAEPYIISTNYDLIADTALMFYSQTRVPDGALPNYGCQIRTGFYVKQHVHFGTLLKLHGSLNLLYCKTCGRLEFGASESTKFLKVLVTVVGPTLKQSYAPDGSECATCKAKLRPLLIAPTHLKDYRNPHVASVWHEAERLLREAERVIFIGYSLPDDDVEVVYLLKRGLAHLKGADFTVVEKDDAKRAVTAHPVGRRYRTLFGDGIDWHPEGMDAWLDAKAAAAASAGSTRVAGTSAAAHRAPRRRPSTRSVSA